MKPLSDCHILVTPTSFGRFDPRLMTDLEKQVDHVTYNMTGKPLTSEKLAELLPGVDGYIAGLDAIDAAALVAADSLQVICRYGTGVDNVDLAAAKARGIVVSNTPGANARSVAELTVAFMLLLARPVIQAAGETRAGGWPRLAGLSLQDKTAGLVGLGGIGKHVVRMLEGFECRTLVTDIAPDQEFISHHYVELVDLAELLAESDFVSLHVPVTPETRGMVNTEFLTAMKDGAALINTSRGELVDEAALVAALMSGKLRGAALDAFDVEPPGADNPLMALTNVIPTPHMGAHTDGAANAMARMAMNDCLAVLQGHQPAHRVA